MGGGNTVHGAGRVSFVFHEIEFTEPIMYAGETTWLLQGRL